MTAKTVIRVRDVMRTSVVSVDGRITVAEALRMMKGSGVGVLIVNKRHEDDEYGIVLLADVAKKVVAKDKSVDRVNVYEIMSKPVVRVHPGMDIRYCARLFERFGLSVAPVMEGGRVIGMVDYAGMVLDGLVQV
jgi:predicted transcriptional regulator